MVIGVSMYLDSRIALVQAIIFEIVPRCSRRQPQTPVVSLGNEASAEKVDVERGRGRR